MASSSPDRPQAISYAAKSTPDEHESIRTQLEDCRALAEREGLDVEADYQDEAASAFTEDRGPGLAAALEHVERIRGVLIVQHSDRLARGDGVKARHLSEIYFWALKAGVTIRSVQDDSTFSNPILAVALGERNAEDSRRKSLAVKAGMKRRREAGKANGGPRPYGYEFRDGGLHVLEHEAEVVRRIFAEYLAGRSQLVIAQGLSADQIPTVRGGKWHQGTVRVMLANELYAGLIDGVPGEHEAIIDRETWEKATALRTAKARTNGPGRPPAGSHLFRGGMLRCQCGEAMVPRTDRNRRQGPYEVYRCYGRHRDPHSCSMPPLDRAMIDTAVYSYFERVGLDFEATRQTLSDARDRKLAEIGGLREEAEREAQRADERLARVRGHYQEGKIEPDDWAEQRPQLSTEREAAHAEATRLREAERAIETGADLSDAEEDMLRKLTEIRRAIAGEIQNAEGIDAARAALGRLFSRFVVVPRNPKEWLLPTVRDVTRDGPEELQSATLWGPALSIRVYVRREAWKGNDVEHGYAPILRREPLSQAEDNNAVGLGR